MMARDPERELALAVLVQAINDRDIGWLTDPQSEAAAYYRMLNLDAEAVFWLRIKLLLGIGVAGIYYRAENRRVHAHRWDVKDRQFTAADSRWASWGSLGVDGMVLGR